MDEKIFGRYRALRLLGEGGMGAVYAAVEHGAGSGEGRLVAIKVLHRRYSQDPQVVARFLNEARASARIGHPGVVPVREVGESPEGAFIVMEYMDGQTLRARLAQARGPFSGGVRLVAELADTLAAAHAQGVVHRDIKPENIMLVGPPGAEQARLLDFGIARVVDDPAGMGTRTGMMLGTPAYMAPEQCRGLRVDDRADVYSVGVVLFEVLTGRPPFQGDLAELMAQHLYAPVPALPGWRQS